MNILRSYQNCTIVNWKTRRRSNTLKGSRRMGGGGGVFFYKSSVPLSLMKTYWMRIISAGSISLDSTFKEIVILHYITLSIVGTEWTFVSWQQEVDSVSARRVCEDSNYKMICFRYFTVYVQSAIWIRSESKFCMPIEIVLFPVDCQNFAGMWKLWKIFAFFLLYQALFYNSFIHIQNILEEENTPKILFYLCRNSYWKIPHFPYYDGQFSILRKSEIK